jgi:hypothetical protein
MYTAACRPNDKSTYTYEQREGELSSDGCYDEQQSHYPTLPVFLLSLYPAAATRCVATEQRQTAERKSIVGMVMQAKIMDRQTTRLVAL